MKRREKGYAKRLVWATLLLLALHCGHSQRLFAGWWGDSAGRMDTLTLFSDTVFRELDRLGVGGGSGGDGLVEESGYLILTLDSMDQALDTLRLDGVSRRSLAMARRALRESRKALGALERYRIARGTRDTFFVQMYGDSASRKVIRRTRDGFVIKDGGTVYEVRDANRISSVRVGGDRGDSRVVVRHGHDGGSGGKGKRGKRSRRESRRGLDRSFLDDLDAAPRFKGHWFGVEFGFSFLAPRGGSFQRGGSLAGYRPFPAGSFKFSIHPLQYSIPIVRGRFGVVTGLGFDLKRYSFLGHGALSGLWPRTEVEQGLVDGRIETRSARLMAYYLSVPLLFEYTGRKRSVWRNHYVSAGVIGSMLLRANYRARFVSGGRYKRTDQLDLLNLQLAPTLRLGYGPMRVFFSVYPLGLLETDAHPYILPVEVGVSFIPF